MKRIPDQNAVGICGLFCGTCPSYPDDCHGCHSDMVRGDCVECVYGFRGCAGEHEVRHCFQCGEFPCRRVEDFSREHIVNGICHHENVIRDLNEMKQTGVGAWVEKQTALHTCPQCGELIIWYDRPHACKG